MVRGRRRRPRVGYITMEQMHWRLLHEKAMALYYIKKILRRAEKRKLVQKPFFSKWHSF